MFLSITSVFKVTTSALSLYIATVIPQLQSVLCSVASSLRATHVITNLACVLNNFCYLYGTGPDYEFERPRPGIENLLKDEF